MRRYPRRVHEFCRMGEGMYVRNRAPRVRDSWPSVLIGFVGIFAGVLLIIWNEARAVATTRALDESVAAITDIPADKEIDSNMVGKLIYMTGAIVVHEPVTDPEYGVSVPAVKLKRRVQMFQWIEEEFKQAINDEPPSTQFFYFTDWRDKFINSALFANPVSHKNPSEFPIKTQILINDKVTVGKFELGDALKEKFNSYEEITSDERPENKDVKLHSGLYYHAQDVWNPEVGDVRIQFSYAGMHGQDISVIGKVDKDNRIVPYKTNLGLNVLLLRMGSVPKEVMFSQEQAFNNLLTWILRALSCFLLYIGSHYATHIFRILCQQSGVIPEVVPTLKMSMSCTIFLLMTAFAWIWYRPTIGIALVVATICVVYMSGGFCEKHSHLVQTAYVGSFNAHTPNTYSNVRYENCK